MYIRNALNLLIAILFVRLVASAFPSVMYSADCLELLVCPPQQARVPRPETWGTGMFSTCLKPFPLLEKTAQMSMCIITDQWNWRGGLWGARAGGGGVSHQRLAVECYTLRTFSYSTLVAPSNAAEGMTAEQKLCRSSWLGPYNWINATPPSYAGAPAHMGPGSQTSPQLCGNNPQGLTPVLLCGL